MMANKMRLSVIAPAYNEEKLLPEFLKSVTACLEKSCLDYELIVVENGSQDQTLQIARSLSRQNKKVRVEHLPQPAYGRALLKGFRVAKGDCLVFYNIDHWDSRFIDLVKSNLLGHDIIVGSKNLPGSEDSRSLDRRLITKSFNLFLRVFLGYKGTDTHGIKAFSRKSIIPVLKKCHTKTGIFDSELMIRAQRGGLKILELPVTIAEKRPNVFGIKRILGTLKDIIELCLALCKE